MLATAQPARQPSSVSGQHVHQLEGPGRAAGEQLRMEHGDAAVGELFRGVQGDPPVHQAEVAARVMQRIVDQHQVRQATSRQGQAAKGEVGTDVAVDQYEGRMAQQWQRTKDAAPGFQRLTLGGEADGDPQRTAIAQGGFQLVAQPGAIAHQLGDTRRRPGPDVMLDQRPAVHLDQRLGQAERQGSHPLALARRQDHGLHASARSACSSSSKAPRSASSGRRATTVRM